MVVGTYPVIPLIGDMGYIPLMGMCMVVTIHGILLATGHGTPHYGVVSGHQVSGSMVQTTS